MKRIGVDTRLYLIEIVDIIDFHVYCCQGRTIIFTTVISIKKEFLVHITKKTVTVLGDEYLCLK